MDQSNVMNFLNEVANQFPGAISLAAGRPNRKFFNPQKWPHYHLLFEQYYAQKMGLDLNQAQLQLCEYGPSSGIINALLRQYLAGDESIETELEQIIVTNGCQEALTLVCLHLLKEPDDCVLCIDPSYVGFSGMVTAIGKRVEPIDADKLYDSSASGGAFNWQYLSEKVNSLRLEGANPKAIYVNPDFNNPLAYRWTEQERLDLLEVCAELNLMIIEDNPYSRFNYTNEQQLSLKALDKTGIVYHIGSFSKTFCPSVRLGYLVVADADSEGPAKLVSLKSLISVNSSGLSQSVVGGFLIDNQCALKQWMEPVCQQYQLQRDAMMAAMTEFMSSIPGVHWNEPQGGFFVVVTLPFKMEPEDVFDCVKNHEVICMPVSFFSVNPEQFKNRVRLSFSFYDAELLSEGIRRFAEYVKGRMPD